MGYAKLGQKRENDPYNSFDRNDRKKIIGNLIDPKVYDQFTNCFEIILDILERVQIEGSVEEREKINSIIKNFGGPKHWYL